MEKRRGGRCQRSVKKKKKRRRHVIIKGGCEKARKGA